VFVSVYLCLNNLLIDYFLVFIVVNSWLKSEKTLEKQLHLVYRIADFI